MKQLTDVELRDVQVRLNVIKQLQAFIATRQEVAKSQDFLLEKSMVDQLAYLCITQGALQVLQQEVDELTKELGIDAADSDEALAQVIQLFDGNHRRVAAPKH